MSTTRILFLSSYSGLGGGETSLLGLLGALDRARFTPTLLCPREGPLTDAARARGVAVVLMPYRGASRWFVPAIWARLPPAARLGSELAAVAPRVVHSDFHTLPFAVPAARAAGVPVIFSCLGWWFRPMPWQRRFYRHGPRRILAISDAVRRGFLGPRPFMDPERVRVLHLGVDTGTFRPRPDGTREIRRALDLPEDGLVVTLVARFQDVKGHDVFLDAARLVLEARPDVTFAMAGENVFGGTADAAFRRRVMRTIDTDPRLSRHVRRLGWVDQAADLIAASTVVVCSSRFESFGMVVVEAMSSGVPVVSTSVGGPAETVVDGETGFLVPPRRPDQIAARVLTLLGDEALRTAMGRAGRARAIERFSLARYAREYGDHVDALTGESHRT
jgi:glycosyltransferase involved in cell wall biosynthesis